MDDERVSATLSTLRSECDICGAWAGFTGETEVLDGLTYAVVRCPNHDGEFSVWNRDRAPLLAAYVRARAASSSPEAYVAASATLTGGSSAEIAQLVAQPPPELPLFSIEDIALPASAALRWIELLLDGDVWRPVPERSVRVEEALATAVTYPSREAGLAIAERVTAAEAASVTARIERRFVGQDLVVLTPVLDRLRVISDAEILLSVAERLCQVVTGAEAEIRSALAMPTEPPPLRAREVEVCAGVLSRASVELRWSPPVLKMSEIDRVFGGPGEALPRTGAGASHVFAYPVAVSGAPARVTVFASFAEKPGPETGAKSVLLRIDPL
jgi:hypothetical protein